MFDCCRFMTTNEANTRPSYACFEHVIRALAAEEQWQSAIGVYDYERRLHGAARSPYYAGMVTIASKL